MRALIVDDEMEIREGLRARIPWSDFGIESVFTADDGDIALELARSERPEVIVADIRMKRMSGLQLLEAWGREQPSGWKAIVVSGYDDFEMVRQAMKLGAMDYILKPINTEELGEIMRRAVGQLEQERRDERNRLLLHHQIQTALPKIREELLREVAGQAYDPFRETRLMHRLRTLELEWIVGGPSAVMIIEADDLKAVDHQKGLRREKELILFGIGNVVKQTLEEEYEAPFVLYEDAKQRWTAVLHCPHEADVARLEQLGRLLIERFHDYVRAKASVALCTHTGSLADLHARYVEAEEILEQKAVYGGDRLLTSRGWEHEAEKEKIPITDPDEVVDLIRYGTEGDIRQAMEQFCDMVKGWQAEHIKDIQQRMFEWLLGIFRQASRLGWSEPGWQRNPMLLWERLERYDTLESLREQAEQYLIGMARDFAGLAASPGQITQEAERFIRRHYADNLTLNSVAAEVHVTPVWLSKLFKKEKRQTFLEFLTEVRMERAKEMLGDVRYKIYQVSSMVGYKDPVHFTKLFKKHAGYTPKEYRNLRGIADE
ncbi:response regulator transcription factor [Paenibacillus macerans]|uniref:response regulator transcription factor n=1 Tax=Paenibacillus macerans TaxID=44252 RepID=UPI003D312F6F